MVNVGDELVWWRPRDQGIWFVTAGGGGKTGKWESGVKQWL